MRDIRIDLKERLTDLSKERAELQGRLTAIEEMESGIMALLAHEELRLSNAGAIASLVLTHPDADGNGFGSTPVSRLILDTLKTSTRPVPLAEFKRLAEEAHIDFGPKKPGRVLHWALVGLTQNGHLGVIGKGENRRYYIREEEEKQAGTTNEAVPARV